MKLFNSGRNKKNRTAVLVYGNKSWHVFILSSRDKECLAELKEVNCEKSDTIPHRIFEWMLENETWRFRVVLPSELHNITLELPERLDMEQTHTAIAWETAELTGANSIGVRHASCRVSAFGIEKNSEQIITASFSVNALKNYRSESKAFGIVFEGVMSLQSVFLALHIARCREVNEAMILLGENSIFAFSPKDSRSGGVMMRNISLDSGFNQNSPDNTNRFRNMLHRLESDILNLSVYTALLNEDEIKKPNIEKKHNYEKSILKIAGNRRDLLNDAKSVSEIFFEEFPDAIERKLKFEDIKSLFLKIALGAEYGNLDMPCPMAILPMGKMEKTRKADRLAALIAAGAVLYVAFIGGFLFIKNYNLKRHNIQAKKFLNKEQSLNSKKEKLAKQLEKYKKIFSLINRGKSANIECLNFMKDIASVIPYGVKLDFMKYSKGNIQLQGSTLSQGAFSQFCSKLDRALKDMKLKIESSSLKQSSDKKKIFELKITTRS